MTTISPQMTSSAFALQWRKTNGLAILSLTLGILQFLLPFVPTALVTIPVSVNALRQTSGQDGRGLAVAGLALSIAHFALYIALFIWLIVAR